MGILRSRCKRVCVEIQEGRIAKPPAVLVWKCVRDVAQLFRWILHHVPSHVSKGSRKQIMYSKILYYGMSDSICVNMHLVLPLIAQNLYK